MATYAKNELVNYMERFVQAAMDQTLPGLNICLCENCRCDIAAIALNELPPKYVVTREGHLYTKLSVFEQQFGIDVTTEVMKAANIVAQNPRHSVDNATND